MLGLFGIAARPQPKWHLEALQEYADAGYDHVCVHRVGPDQAGFMQFYKTEILTQAQGRPQGGLARWQERCPYERERRISQCRIHAERSGGKWLAGQ